MSNGAAGFLLLTVPDCRIDTGGQVYNGQLALECVTIAQGSNNDIGERDIWLVLRIGALELAIPPVQPILHDRAHGVYTIPGQPNAVLPLASPNFITQCPPAQAPIFMRARTCEPGKKNIRTSASVAKRDSMSAT